MLKYYELRLQTISSLTAAVVLCCAFCMRTGRAQSPEQSSLPLTRNASSRILIDVDGRSNPRCLALDNSPSERGKIDSNHTTEIITFQRTIGESGEDRASCVLQTSDGGYLIGGSSQGVRTERFASDMYVIKIDSSGKMIWSKSYGRGELSSAHSIVATPDSNYLVAGGVQFNDITKFFFIKIDSQGSTLWESVSGIQQVQYEYYPQVVTFGDGSFAIAGTSGDSMDVIGLVLKMSPIGVTEWFRLYESSQLKGYDWAQDIDCSADGLILVSGYSWQFDSNKNHGWVLKLDLRSGLVWSAISDSSISYHHILATRDGGCVISGSEFQGKKTKSLLTKLDEAGSPLWKQLYDFDPESYTISSIIELLNGDLVVAGTIFPAGNSIDNTIQSDVMIIRTDSAGHPLWKKRYGGRRAEHASTMRVTKDGGLIVVGEFRSSSGPRVYILKTDEHGNVADGP